MHYDAPFKVADVINKFRHKLNPDKISYDQHKVMNQMSACRTPAMGINLAYCPECGKQHLFYKSCRNRHCNVCGSQQRDVWIAKRKADALPVDYYHIVFTVPDYLNALFMNNSKVMFNLLFKCSWETICLFASKHKHLGAKTGMTALLHTWGQTLAYHPHLHCLVPRGGITPQNKWRNAKTNGKYIFPVKAVSKVFRGKFINELILLQKNSNIALEEPIEQKNIFKHPLYKHKWVVYAKQPSNGGEQIVEYIARYSHRVAISNSRILNIDNGKVTFSWFDYRKSKADVMTLTGEEFLRRFLMHTLPQKFVKVRHYGILCCRSKEKYVELVHHFYGLAKPPSIKELSNKELLTLFYGKSPHLCPDCNKGELVFQCNMKYQRGPPTDIIMPYIDFNF